VPKAHSQVSDCFQAFFILLAVEAETNDDKITTAKESNCRHLPHQWVARGKRDRQLNQDQAGKNRGEEGYPMEGIYGKN
jgi:hypothetical protein